MIKWICFIALSLNAVNYTWVGPDLGSWNQPNNWSPNSGFPTGSSDQAIFNNANLSVINTLDMGVGADSIVVTNSSSSNQLEFFSNNIFTDGTLFLGGGPSHQIQVNSGDLFVRNVIQLNSNVNFISNGVLESLTDITGSYGVAVSGTGYVFIEDSTYTGGTTLTGCTLECGGALGTGNLEIIGASKLIVLDLTNNVILSVDGVIQQDDYNGVIDGNISGSGGVIKSGSKALALHGTNTFTGGVTVFNGTLQIPADVCLGSASGTITLSGGTFQAMGDITTSRPFEIANNSTLDANTHTLILTGTVSGGSGGSGGTLDCAGNPSLSAVHVASGTFTITGTLAGSQTLTQTGAGILILSGTNTYSGGTVVSNGTLQISKDSALGDIAGTMTLNGGALQVIGDVTSSRKFNVTSNSTLDANLHSLVLTGTLSGSDGVTLSCVNNPSLNTVSVATSATFTITGTLAGSQTLTKTGNGTLILSGTNTYSGGTIVSAGTLQGNGASLQGPITDNGSVVFNQTANANYSSVISGTGSLTKIGSGTLILSATNTYSGGTTLSNGTLQISKDNALGNIAGTMTLNGGVFQVIGDVTSSRKFNVISNSTLDANLHSLVLTGTLSGSDGVTLTCVNAPSLNTVSVATSATFTITGTLAGSQTLTKTGNGTLILSGTNTYSGGTLVSAGTLQGNAASLQGPITDNGSVVFNQTTDAAYNLAISGTGSLTKIGNGTLILSATNTYSGGTTVSAGTLQGNTVSLQGPIANDASVVFNQTIDGTYSSAMSQTGSLTKIGPATLVLSATNTFSGQTTVSVGKLQVDGTLTASPVTVQNGATLSGIGKIQNTVTVQSGGILSPGHSPGVLQVNGLVLNAGAVYHVEIDPALNPQNSEIIVTGDVILNTNTIQVVAAPGVYPKNETYTIMTYTGTKTGNFNPEIVSPLPGYILTLSEFGNQINLNLQRGIFLNCLTYNSLVIGNVIDDFIQDFLSDFDFLSRLSCNQLNLALETISPSRNAYTAYVSQNTSLALNDLVGSRLSNSRLLRQKRGAGALFARNDFYRSHNPIVASKPKPYNIWATGLWDISNQDAQKQNPGFSVMNGGFLVAFDYGNLNRGLVGAAAAYVRSTIHQKNKFGNDEINAGYLSLYGTVFFSNAFLELATWGGYQRFNHDRHIFFPGFSETASSGYNGYQVTPHIGLGADWNWDAFTFEPFANFDAAMNIEGSYTESGAGDFNTHVPSRFSSMLRSEGGLNSYLTEIMSRGIFITRVKLSYVNKQLLDTGRIQAAFVGVPDSFVVEAFDSNNQNLFSTLLELYWKGNKGGFASFIYEGEFGSDYMTNMLALKFGKNF
jgi:autotransporter-associated beta strand protein